MQTTTAFLSRLTAKVASTVGPETAPRVLLAMWRQLSPLQRYAISVQLERERDPLIFAACKPSRDELEDLAKSGEREIRKLLKAQHPQACAFCAEDPAKAVQHPMLIPCPECSRPDAFRTSAPAPTFGDLKALGLTRTQALQVARLYAEGARP